jgi:replication factor A1
LLNIDLSDNTSSIIQATLFKEAIEKYESMLEEGCQYLFGNGMIRPSNKKFTHIEHDFNISFDKMAII